MNKNIFKNGPWKDSEKLTKKKNNRRNRRNTGCRNRLKS